MSRTSKADKNYLSLDADNVVWFAGTDEWRYEPGPIPTILRPYRAQDWDAIFKTSNRANAHLTGLSIAQGGENASDQNDRTRDCSFHGDFGVGGGEGDQVITTKGGSHDIAYSGTIWSKGRRADCVCGAWADQSQETTHHIDYSGLSRADGQPVTFILSRVNSPFMAALGRPKDITLPKGARVLFWASVLDQCYYWLKFAAVKLHILPSK